MKTELPGLAARSPPPVRPRFRRRWVQGVAWITLYVLLVAFPLLALLLGSGSPGGGFAWDFAMAIAFGGLAIMGLQFVLTARFRRASAPFGVDIIYFFHRWAAIGGLVLIGAHYLILRIAYASALGPASPLAASAHMTAGRISLGLFVVLTVTSIWRKALGTNYDTWRVLHGLMALVAVVLAIWHIQGVGHYTRAPWRGAVWLSYTAFWVLVLGYIRMIKPLRLLRNPYRVIGVQQETASAWTVTLTPEQPPVLAFRPGQFAWLTLGASPFQAQEHPFSFSGSAEDSHALRFTIKELGDFTRTIKHVKFGEIAYVDGPHGVFTTDFYPEAPGFVFVAGGVGIAPIMSMLRSLADRGDIRPLYLLYGNPTWDAVLFRDELETLKGRLKLTVVHTLDEPPSGWSGATGFVTEKLLRATIPPGTADHVCFLCGPKAMTDSVSECLRRLHYPLHRIHFELFEMA